MRAVCVMGEPRKTQPICMHVRGWGMEPGDRGSRQRRTSSDAERWQVQDSCSEGGGGMACSLAPVSSYVDSRGGQGLDREGRERP